MPSGFHKRTLNKQSRNMRYKLNESKMFADISDGMAIVINSITGVYYGMNGFGTEVFQSLLSGSEEGLILETVCAFPGAPATAGESLMAFIEKLLGFDMLVPSEEGGPAGVAINPSTASMDNFVPECNEYKDVQELLFADPIHEVDADTGWKPEK